MDAKLVYMTVLVVLSLPTAKWSYRKLFGTDYTFVRMTESFGFWKNSKFLLWVGVIALTLDALIR